MPEWLTWLWGTDPATRERRRIFEAILRDNAWGSAESVSGPGSDIARATLFRPDFEALIRALGVRTLLDVPCGDFNWLGEFDLGLERYTGVDILPELISRNRKRHASPRRRFLLRDMVRDRLPRADMILCRDGLVHLTDADVFATLRNFKRTGSTWLLTNTFEERPGNPPIATGEWRPLNLQAPPFMLPPPAQVIDEQCLGYGGVYRDKRLSLWRLADLQLPTDQG